MKVQLINGISNDLQKVFKCFNGTAIFTPSFLLFSPSATVLPIIPAVCLNEGALSLVKTVLISLTFNSSVLNCHKLPDVSE